MYLLKLREDEHFSREWFPADKIPPYAILSHTWGRGEVDEVTFNDINSGTGSNKNGYKKLIFCGKQAKKDCLNYFWVDTCCIDKSNEKELTTAINSMFRWYQNSSRCYIYLSDVSVSARDDKSRAEWDSAFRSSRWFTRGWTLQELLAPKVAEFYSRDQVRLGDKKSLEHKIQGITGIPIEALRGKDLTSFSVQERLKWKENRTTTEEEDMAYCLIGIFDVSLTPIYGEGRIKAMNRLLREIEWSKNPSQPHEPFHLVQTLKGHGDTVTGLSFSADGRQLASAGKMDGSILLWDVAKGSIVHNFLDSNSHWCVSHSSNGRWLAAGSGNNIILWDTVTKSVLRTLRHSDSYWKGVVWCIAFSRNGKKLASGSGDSTIKLWDPASGAMFQTFNGHRGDVWSVAFSPDGGTLASGSSDNTIRIWDTVTGSPLRTFNGHSNRVNSVAVSIDSRWLSSASNDNTIRLWDVATGHTIRTLEGHGGNWFSGKGIRGISFSPDGRRLASAAGDETIGIWDIETGSILQRLTGHSSGIHSVAFSPDGRQLASGSIDRTIRLWSY